MRKKTAKKLLFHLPYSIFPLPVILDLGNEI